MLSAHCGARAAASWNVRGGRYDKQVNTSTVHTFEVAGTHTHVWEYGSADGWPVFLVHGFRGDHHGLEGLAESLAEKNPGKRFLVPDLPGFGETGPMAGTEHNLAAYGDWLVALVAEAAPEGHTMLGHSFGSLVVSAALRAGLSPDQVILVNPIASPALEGPQAVLTQLAIGYYKAGSLLPERAAKELLGNRLIVRVMSEVMAKTRDPELRAWIHAQHHAYFSAFSDSATLLEAFKASVSHTVREFAGEYRVPTLLIVGDRDDITPLAAQLDLERRIPGATLRIIPGTGHLVHYEAVADAAAWITDALGGAE
ncbi:alpha/beta hydrolase [Leucobacter sp. cx-328]|nr:MULTISPECIES: alpha/beta hydrolase [unclassified Leucobacter]MBC9943933.1 alpha/beta hydrolase [Leucobacter sp. cx-328]